MGAIESGPGKSALNVWKRKLFGKPKPQNERGRQAPHLHGAGDDGI